MNKTQIVYDCIVKFISSNGYPPTVREICPLVKLNSTSSVEHHLKKLENAGKIIRNGKKNRAIELTEKSVGGVSIPLLGQIAAGQPILAEENLIDKFMFSEDLFRGRDLFMLKVKGDSMVNAGILNGDFVIISKQDVANNGEIVACLIENEATVKRFYKENGYFRLQPENSYMRPILTNQVSILGKVVGLIRNNF